MEPSNINVVEDLEKKQEEQEIDPIKDKLDFQKFSPKLNTLITYFTSTIEPLIESNRNKRRLDTDSEALRASKDLAADETFIPIRVIDQNIMAELPPLVNYFVSPPRIAIFKDASNQEVNDKKLEAGFTTCVKYPGWIYPIYRVLDGAGAHGYSVLEVGYAPEQPGKFEFYDVGAGDFLYPEGTLDIQAAPFCGIRLQLSSTQIEALAEEEGFNKGAITELLDKHKDNQKVLELRPFFKIFVKCEGVVYVLWYSQEVKDKWIREPMPHTVGIMKKVQVEVPVEVITEVIEVDPITGQEVVVEVPETQIQIQESIESEPLTTYPVFILPYTLSENKCIDDYDGRAIKDAAVQEAMTSQWSSIVNGTARASNVYAAPEGDVEPGTAVELLDVTLKAGNVYSRKMSFFSQPYPSDTALRSVQALDSKNKESTGQLAATVNNRQDSRKTAAETNLAKEQEGKLDSVSILLFSLFLGDVLNFVWKIVQAQAILGYITIYPAEVPQTNPLQAAAGVPPDSANTLDVPPVNDLAVISKEYILYPAGDADYIQVEERKEHYQNYWPIAQSFPQLAPIFAADMFKDVFRANGERYAKILEATAMEPQYQALATNLFMMLEELIKDPAVANLPQIQQALPGLQQIKMMLGTGTSGAPAPGGNPNGQPQQPKQLN